MTDEFTREGPARERSELKTAKQLCVTVFRRPCALNQEAVADGLRRGLDGWRKRLDRFSRQAQKGRFPGSEDIETCLRLVRTLRAIEDPGRLVRTVSEKAEALTAAGKTFKQLNTFYKQGVSRWEALLSVISEYLPFRESLDEDGVRALDRLVAIHRTPRPYELVDEIGDLTARVRGAYRRLVADRRRQAEKRLDEMAAQVRLALDRRGADPQRCSRTLRPLRQFRSNLAWASRVPDILSLLDAAEDLFENMVDGPASEPPSRQD